MTFLSRKKGTAQTPDFEDVTKTASTSDPDPETLMLESCTQEQLRGALAQLSPEFREAIVLRELEEMSYKEIATVTGVPMGTVMSRISRAREGLRGLLTSRRKGAGSR
jgi:RNA polymerase sigma-70 factor (ECF subfamily)